MKKKLKYSAIGLAVLLLLLWFGGRGALSFSSADYEGEIALPGIQQAVEITFDAKGIPQIWAENDRDMFLPWDGCTPRSACSRWNWCGGW